MKEWKEININYWNEIANSYEKLYEDDWSFLEDSFIKEVLGKIIKPKDMVVDLGCGLCLGYKLLKEVIDDFEYIGVDISSAMVKKAKSKYPELTIIETSMCELTQIADRSIDVVICINTSFSFAFDVQKTITEIKRILKKGGRIVISVLSKWSVRRILKFRFGNLEDYSTRNSSTKNNTKAWVFSCGSLKQDFSNNGFGNIKIEGYNAMVGLVNKKWIWKTNLFLSKLNRNFSHDLILTAEYNV